MLNVNYNLTIDANLMHVEPKLPAMGTLERWNSEGKIVLVEAEPRLGASQPDSAWPRSPSGFAQASQHQRNIRGPVKRAPAGAKSFKEFAAVLFPYKDPQKLNMGEVNDVAHLVRHHTSKNEMFITGNLKGFIDSGRRELLKAVFGIVTMTPEEATEMLSKKENWN